MGSSSEWTKDYIKSNKSILKKEILQIYPTRKLANGGEVYFLKSVENNTLCVNKYFGYTSDDSDGSDESVDATYNEEYASFYEEEIAFFLKPSQSLCLQAK